MADKEMSIRSGDTDALAITLAEGFAAVATALVRVDPDLPERAALEDVLRQLHNHVSAAQRTDALAKIDRAWGAVQP